MAISIEMNSGGHCLAVVEGSFTIYEAAAAKCALLEALAKAKEIDVDLSAVHEMDTAGLQLLILAKRESLRAGKGMRLTAHSAASLDALERYNLAAFFGRATTIASRTRKQPRKPMAKKRLRAP